MYGPFDTGVSSLSWTALVLWLLGYPDQALKKSQETLALAQELAHPFSLAQALVWTSWFHQLLGDERGTQEAAEAAIRLSSEHRFSVWLAMATKFRGWALVRQGHWTEGMAQLQQGLADTRAMETGYDLDQIFAFLAECYWTAGQREEALTALADALAQVDKTENRSYEAELYRLKARLTIQNEVPGLKGQVTEIQQPRSWPQAEAEAEQCLQRAIEIANRQASKSLELRAATSLARLWQHQDKKDKARKRLTEIYSWFTEGFDTADLKDAKALLDELSS
jgi:predicted ATPase